MERKIEETLLYEGAGFPVMLCNVPMVKAMGEWAPDIDINLFHNVVLICLAQNSVSLTGNQVRFIRLWLEMTQEVFSKLLGVTQAAVVKWEKAKNRSAKISTATEKQLRIYVVDQVLKKDRDFRNAYRNILQMEFFHNDELLYLDASTDLVAI